MDTIKATVGSSFKIKNAKMVEKIGFKNASENAFDSSILFTPSKSKYIPSPVDTIPKKNIQNQDFKS